MKRLPRKVKKKLKKEARINLKLAKQIICGEKHPKTCDCFNYNGVGKVYGPPII